MVQDPEEQHQVEPLVQQVREVVDAALQRLHGGTQFGAGEVERVPAQRLPDVRRDDPFRAAALALEREEPVPAADIQHRHAGQVIRDAEEREDVTLSGTPRGDDPGPQLDRVIPVVPPDRLAELGVGHPNRSSSSFRTGTQNWANTRSASYSIAKSRAGFFGSVPSCFACHAISYACSMSSASGRFHHAP